MAYKNEFKTFPTKDVYMIELTNVYTHTLASNYNYYGVPLLLRDIPCALIMVLLY